MAIVVRLDDVLHDRRMTLTELSDRIGVTLPNLSILKTGKARAIRFSTLDAICAALECQPGDEKEEEPQQVNVDRSHALVARAIRGEHLGNGHVRHLSLDEVGSSPSTNASTSPG